jgi:hypothetical protein
MVCKFVPPDPMKHCHVYKTVGCVHVDGPICDIRTCDMTLSVTIVPNAIIEQLQNARARA